MTTGAVGDDPAAQPTLAVWTRTRTGAVECLGGALTNDRY
jgi:hypothetical protein